MRVTRPIVLVATSSEYQADAILAQTAFDALAGTEMTVIATLPSSDPGALRVPPNGRAERFVPHGQILARASVAITHGGMGRHPEGPRRGCSRRRRSVRARSARGGPAGGGRRRRRPTSDARSFGPRRSARPSRPRSDRREGALAVAAGYRAAGGPEAAAVPSRNDAPRGRLTRPVYNRMVVSMQVAPPDFDRMFGALADAHPPRHRSPGDRWRGGRGRAGQALRR